MKKKILFSILFLLFLNNIQAFSLSTHPDISKNEKLFLICKIWGFLKYYHPKVADGKYNWDNELFEILSKTTKANNKEELNQILNTWIDGLGKIKNCHSCKNKPSTDYFEKNFDLNWIKDTTIIQSSLSNKLDFIRKNRFQGKHYYVSKNKYVSNVKIVHEIEYDNFDWRNENLRILSLFRYWNIIEYFFPYKYQIDKIWDDVLIEFIPKFLSPKTELDYHLSMLELVVNVNDSHANLFTEKTLNFFGNKYIPAFFKILEEKAIITGYYDDSLAIVNDIRKGDLVSKIDGKSIASIIKEKISYVNGSNINAKLKNFYYVLFNGKTDSVEIEFAREKEVFTKKIGRYYFKQFKRKHRNKDKWEIMKGNIGYVNLGNLEKSDVSAMMDSLIDTKAIIFDIRNYPNQALYNMIAYYLVFGKKIFYKSIVPDFKYPGKFIWKDGRECGNDQELKYKGKVYLLVSERTQSHGEFTTMCLQKANNVTTIGSQTSGADGNISAFKFVGGFRTGISGIGIFYPNKNETQRHGVKIDIRTESTIEGIREGRDEVLEKALELATKYNSP